MKTIISILIMTCAISAQADSISDVAFLSGCWSVQDGDTTITESWMPATANLMQGVAQTKNSQNEVVEYEFLRIAKKSDGTLAYTPYINGQQMPDFIFDSRSKSSDSHRAVFVNNANDFPKSISYSQLKSDSSQLSIRLEGLDESGSALVIEYPLFKTDCNPAL